MCDRNMRVCICETEKGLGLCISRVWRRGHKACVAQRCGGSRSERSGWVSERRVQLCALGSEMYVCINMGAGSG